MASIQPDVFLKIGYGVYLVTSLGSKSQFNGLVANVVVQITSNPAQFAICINKNNLTHGYIQRSKVFGVTILEEATPMTFIGTFGFKSGRDINKFENISFELGSETDAPLVLDYGVGVMELEVVGEMDAITHTLFVGQVKSARIIKDTPAMTYAYYREVKKGKSSKLAPTFVADRKGVT